MKIQLISLFPAMFEGVVNNSMLLKAQKLGLVKFDFINLRQFGLGAHQQVDDTPYGGGDGMLLMIEPLVKAIEFAKKQDPKALVILPTPKGETYTQLQANELASQGHGLIFICPRYEGYDERLTNWVDKQYCLGRYVLTGGEIPAMAIMDSVIRLIPGVLGGQESTTIESFQSDLSSLEYPQFTRPSSFRGLSVPEVLMSGNHQEIKYWRQNNSTKAQD